MKTTGGDVNMCRLRANISIETKVTTPRTVIHGSGITEPILSRGTRLPAEATYEFSNARAMSSTIEISLFFGDNQFSNFDVSLGRFFLKGFRHVPYGPSQIRTKISVNAHRMLCLSVIDPCTKGYRSVGFTDLCNVEPPPIVPVSPDPIMAYVADLIEMAETRALPKKRPASRGEDMSHGLAISFSEALQGVQKHVELLGDRVCPTCAGSGSRPGSSTKACPNCQGTGTERTQKGSDVGTSVTLTGCRTCNGTGQVIANTCTDCQGETLVSGRRPFTVNIPPGIDSGAQIFYPGQGEPGKHRGRPGHLYIDVTVAENPLFTRLGRHASIRLPVSAGFAKEGGQLRVPDIKEESFFLLDLPPNTRDGATFRVYGDESSYTLDAVIETYHPYNPLAKFKNQKRLRVIKEALNQREYEIRV